jgi:hypothetical protein
MEDLAPVCVKLLLTRVVGYDEIGLSHLPRFAGRHAGSRTDRAPPTHDVRHAEGNYQSYLEDLQRRKGADADQLHRVQFKQLVPA